MCSTGFNAIVKMYSAGQINVVKGCVSRSFNDETVDHVSWPEYVFLSLVVSMNHEQYHTCCSLPSSPISMDSINRAKR